eukprot:5038843-Pleurochrysis_carterae.AAC.1
MMVASVDWDGDFDEIETAIIKRLCSGATLTAASGVRSGAYATPRRPAGCGGCPSSRSRPGRARRS